MNIPEQYLEPDQDQYDPDNAVAYYYGDFDEDAEDY